MNLKDIFEQLKNDSNYDILKELYNNIYNIIDLIDDNNIDIKSILLNELKDINISLKELKNYQTNYVLTNITNKVDKKKENDSNDLADAIKYIIKYLNDKTGKHYRNVVKTQKLIKARLNEGYTIEDFEKVIDIKSSEWLHTDMELYLRPETLFSNKFEGYLNQGINNKKKLKDFMNENYKKTGDLF